MTDPLLLTPGPLTTSPTVKAAMLRDWGSRDPEFIAMNTRVRTRLLELAGAERGYACVPLAGSGTTIVEAAIATAVPAAGTLLVVCNGAYGRRMLEICSRLGRKAVRLDSAEELPVHPEAIDRTLDANPEITDVALVHCETTSGVLNPLESVAELVHRQRRRLIVDAMSSFGALPIDLARTPIDVLVASSNKCLEAVPGLAFALARTDLLTARAGNAPSLTLDLTDQWQAMGTNGQWRFTPPTHIVAALDRALQELSEEGGPAARLARYQRNCRDLVDGMSALGFQTLVAPEHQAPIIVTFRMPSDPGFEFQRFYNEMSRRGFVIYPGKLTATPSFRIGCIGHLPGGALARAVDAARDTLLAMGVRSGAPAKAS